MRCRSALVVLAALWLAGCSALSHDEEIEPADLTAVEQEIEVDELWSRRLTGSLGDKYHQYRPAFLGDRIYSVDAEGDLVSADAATGKELWAVDIDTPIAGGVAAGDGKVAVATYDGRLLTFSALDGEPQWQARLSSEAVAPAVIAEGKLVVRTVDDRLHAFDAESGEASWGYTAQKPSLTLRGTGSPLAVRGRVIAGFASGKLVALRLDSGEVLWESAVAVPEGQTELERMVDIDGDLVAGNGVVYATAYQGRMATVDQSTGRVLWSRPFSSYQGVAESEEQLYAVTATGEVHAFDKLSSTELWAQQGLYYRQPTAPAYIGGVVALADFEGYVHFLSTQDGRFVARVRADSDGVASPLSVRGNILYVLGNSGRVTAFRIGG